MQDCSYTDELRHYGVPGMRWGHRKAQPTTSSGTKRYRYADALKGYDNYHKKVTKALGGQNNRTNAYAAQAIARTLANDKPSKLQKALYTANVLRIAKKDNSTKRDRMQINDKDTKLTKLIKTDYNNLSDLEFRAKYKTSKNKYAKRVKKSKSGDPLKTGKAAVVALMNAKEVATTMKTGKSTAARTNEMLSKNRETGRKFASSSLNIIEDLRLKDLK